jgi:hypothetical protein
LQSEEREIVVARTVSVGTKETTRCVPDREAEDKEENSVPFG